MLDALKLLMNVKTSSHSVVSVSAGGSSCPPAPLVLFFFESWDLFFLLDRFVVGGGLVFYWRVAKEVNLVRHACKRVSLAGVKVSLLTSWMS